MKIMMLILTVILMFCFVNYHHASETDKTFITVEENLNYPWFTQSGLNTPFGINPSVPTMNLNLFEYKYEWEDGTTFKVGVHQQFSPIHQQRSVSFGGTVPLDEVDGVFKKTGRFFKNAGLFIIRIPIRVGKGIKGFVAGL